MGKEYIQRVANLCDAVNASSSLLTQKIGWKLGVRCHVVSKVPSALLELASLKTCCLIRRRYQAQFDEFMSRTVANRASDNRQISEFEIVEGGSDAYDNGNRLQIDGTSLSLYGSQQQFVGENNNEGRVNLFDGGFLAPMSVVIRPPLFVCPAT